MEKKYYQVVTATEVITIVLDKYKSTYAKEYIKTSLESKGIKVELEDINEILPYEQTIVISFRKPLITNYSGFQV